MPSRSTDTKTISIKLKPALNLTYQVKVFNMTKPLNRIFYGFHKNESLNFIRICSKITLRLLKPGPPRQCKPITGQNWNKRFQHFKIQPIKCRVQHNEISTCSLTGDEYATTAPITFLSSNCLSFSSFAFLRFPEVLFVNKLYPM